MEDQKYYIISVWRKSHQSDIPQLNIRIYNEFEDMMNEWNKDFEFWFRDSHREAFGDDKQAMAYAKKLIEENKLEWVNGAPLKGSDPLKRYIN